MNCNCTWTNAILAVIAIIFAFVSAGWAKWVVVIAAVLIIIHEFAHPHMKAAAAPAMKAKK